MRIEFFFSFSPLIGGDHIGKGRPCHRVLLVVHADNSTPAPDAAEVGVVQPPENEAVEQGPGVQTPGATFTTCGGDTLETVRRHWFDRGGGSSYLRRARWRWGGLRVTDGALASPLTSAAQRTNHWLYNIS